MKACLRWSTGGGRRGGGDGLHLVQESNGDPPVEGVLFPPLESDTGMLHNVSVSRIEIS